jgi:protein ImuB
MFAVLHIADFALHAVLRTAPDLAAQPVALLDGARQRAQIVAANAAARAVGVAPGLTAPQALARCALLVLQQAQPAAEAEARAALLAAAFTLGPMVEATAPGVATIDVAGRAAANREPALRAAVQTLAGLGLPATGGLARTPLLALYAARQTTDVFAVGDDAAFLTPLPLATAEPPPELAEILAGWGVHTLGQFTALPKAEISRRLGAAGVTLWERAAGQTARPLQPVAPPQTFTATMEFPEPVETLEPLLFVLRRFVDRLALELRTAGLAAAELALRLGLDDETTHARSFRLPEPTADADILFRALHTHLETLRTDAPIGAVRLDLTPTRTLEKQQDLFETSLRDPHGFAETLARTVAVVGSGRVGTPRLVDTHRSDVVELAPSVDVVPPATETPVHAPLGLPLRRFRPPLAAKIELAGRAPAYVWCERLYGPVTTARGPWRGAGDWWHAEFAWEREEWDVALAGGGLYRVLRTPAGWFVEGEYD